MRTRVRPFASGEPTTRSSPGDLPREPHVLSPPDLSWVAHGPRSLRCLVVLRWSTLQPGRMSSPVPVGPASVLVPPSCTDDRSGSTPCPPTPPSDAGSHPKTKNDLVRERTGPASGWNRPPPSVDTGVYRKAREGTDEAETLLSCYHVWGS